MKINGGKLDRKLTLLIPTTTTDDYQQTITSYTAGKTIYAQRLEMRTQDAARAGGRETYATARYLIRHRADLTTSYRVKVEGIVFDILAIDPVDRRATMILTLEQVTGTETGAS